MAFLLYPSASFHGSALVSSFLICRHHASYFLSSLPPQTHSLWPPFLALLVLCFACFPCLSLCTLVTHFSPVLSVPFWYYRISSSSCPFLTFSFISSCPLVSSSHPLSLSCFCYHSFALKFDLFLPCHSFSLALAFTCHALLFCSLLVSPLRLHLHHSCSFSARI